MAVSGALSITHGVLLTVTDGPAGLGGAVGITTQYAAEPRHAAWSAQIPDLWFVAVALARRRSERSQAVHRRA